MAGKGQVDPREIADRRLKVARLRLAGVRNQGKIAERLGVSRATIVRDFKVIDEDWQREYLASIQREKALDVARVDALISAAWQEAMKGSTRHIRVINELLARRAALLGSDAPAKTQVEHDGQVTVAHVDLDPDTRAVLEEAERIILQRFHPADA